MTEWTSISVTEAQKETLQEEKPDGMAMGVFLAGLIDSHSTQEDCNIDVEQLADELTTAVSNGDPVTLDFKNELAVVRQEIEETRQAALEATNAAHAAEKAVESLGPQR